MSDELLEMRILGLTLLLRPGGWVIGPSGYMLYGHPLPCRALGGYTSDVAVDRC